MINIKENEKLSVMNHSCAHLLAQAVQHLYPNAKFWVGPVIEEGFYYDIDLGDTVIKEEDLEKIEKEMKKIAKDGKRIVRHDIQCMGDQMLTAAGGSTATGDLIGNTAHGQRIQ